MHALLEQLDTERRAFVQGTSFHIQSYETEEGLRFSRRMDGSYANGGTVYPSLIELLEATLGPITPAQLYALVAIYHPLVTARISPDHQPHEMSRSQARAFIMKAGTILGPDDVSLEAGKLRFGALGGRPSVDAVAPPSPPPPPAPPRERAFKAVVEVTYRAEGDMSEEDIRADIQSALPQLIKARSGATISATQVHVASMASEASGLQPA